MPDMYYPDQGIDLGHGHFLEYSRWAPDRDLNPQYDGLPDVERVGAIVRHATPDGAECMSGILFDCEETKAMLGRVFPGRAAWMVESWAPLTISPSLLCLRCGDHGFIRRGKWEPA